MQICAELINKVTIKKIDFYNLLAIHVHIFTIFGAKDDLLFVGFLIEKKNSLCNAYINYMGMFKFVDGR